MVYSLGRYCHPQLAAPTSSAGVFHDSHGCMKSQTAAPSANGTHSYSRSWRPTPTVYSLERQRHPQLAVLTSNAGFFTMSMVVRKATRQHRLPKVHTTTTAVGNPHPWCNRPGGSAIRNWQRQSAALGPFTLVIVAQAKRQRRLSKVLITTIAVGGQHARCIARTAAPFATGSATQQRWDLSRWSCERSNGSAIR